MGQWEREGEDPMCRALGEGCRGLHSCAPKKQERVSGAKLGG